MTNTHAAPSQLSHFVSRIGAGIGWAVNGIFVTLVEIGAASGRMQELERLQAMSDEELAELGLRREDIVRHVFRDRLHV
ncbi:DUF1127 domain-containing protein [Rhodobacteraceae bacterium 2CG4]|uniref:DUF1127 domain-containing protein n=2 Tax=Halovulum marinum TaxID=2662447 RepID=A0A6L5Z107_9RHOB|nr:DUF1127 domain-containing protein [Halovulum marinum]